MDIDKFLSQKTVYMSCYNKEDYLINPNDYVLKIIPIIKLITTNTNGRFIIL